MAASEIFLLNELTTKQQPTTSLSSSDAANLTITKSNKHHHLTTPAGNLFHRSQTQALILDLSSESLINECREGNLNNVREILKSSLKAPDLPNDNQLTVKSLGGRRFSPIKIDLEAHDDMGQTALNVAARFNHTEICHLLLEYGSKVSTPDKDSWTPLLNAAKNGNMELVRAFVLKRAHLEDRDPGGFTPLIWAAYKNHLSCVSHLLKAGADANAKCKMGISCLSWAAGRGYYEVVCELLNIPNIKVNSQDQNGSTAILWASRKGNLKIVEKLIECGANPEIPGMSNSTPLIMSIKNGFADVALNLSQLPNSNPNHADKDGNTALSIASKQGYKEIVLNLLEKGAYLNTQNKKGDSILITAVKSGHKEIIHALLSRSVEIDFVGNQSKTALHHAVDKLNIEVVKMLLNYKPDLEIVSKDGDTPLLLATKRKSAPIVFELLNSGSKVSAADKNGDNSLHISLRNKNREITELILSNPKNSKYLYKPNRRGETPYKIDASNPKSILTQIFGARQLNMSEDSILGYDVYSSALAEILSEPSLHTPITVGLYAKWGSGKSFLLQQLKNEMKSFAKLTKVLNLKIDFSLILIILILGLVISAPFLFWKWIYGASIFAGLTILSFAIIIASKYLADRKSKEWALRLNQRLAKQITHIKLLARILFLNAFYYMNTNSGESGGTGTTSNQMTKGHKNLKFLFIEYGKISTIGGETALAVMIASLYTKLEMHYGLMTTRLCRVFYNKQNAQSHSKFRLFCFIPTFVLIVAVVVFSCALLVFVRVRGVDFVQFSQEERLFVITVLFIILVSILGSFATWMRFFYYLIISPSSRIMSQIHKSQAQAHSHQRPEAAGLENLIFKLKREVDIMSYTVRSIDTFTHSCTRLVIVIDGLDSCEQSKVVQILEIVHVLFTREGDPFISILAVDPHVLIKGIEGNLTEAFKNGSVNGHDYLRTIIHLPVYLQVNLTKAKALGKVGGKLINKTHSIMMGSTQDIMSHLESNLIDHKGKTKAKKHESNKPMNAYDLTDQLIKSDYFLDVNPRNIRRLINIIALTGRLLRAYHIDFNWRVLAFWIYLNEQWPYRCSWIVMHYEDHESEFTEQTTLSEIYEKVRSQIPSINEPLLELDRNPRKFEQFIQNCEPKLTCVILKRLLPCTCNLDPYLIKLIKESIELNNERVAAGHHPPYLASNTSASFNQAAVANSNHLNPYAPSSIINNRIVPQSFGLFYENRLNNEVADKTSLSAAGLIHRNSLQRKMLENKSSGRFEDTESNRLNNKHELSHIEYGKLLNEMSMEEVCEEILHTIKDLSSEHRQIYSNTIKEKNICGKVLSMCEMDELKSELRMTFGDWLLFRNWLIAKRSSAAVAASAQYNSSFHDLSRSNSMHQQHQQAKQQSPNPTPPPVRRSTSKCVTYSGTESLSNIPEIIMTSHEDSEQDESKKKEEKSGGMIAATAQSSPINSAKNIPGSNLNLKDPSKDTLTINGDVASNKHSENNSIVFSNDEDDYDENDDADGEQDDDDDDDNGEEGNLLDASKKANQTDGKTSEEGSSLSKVSKIKKKIFTSIDSLLKKSSKMSERESEKRLIEPESKSDSRSMSGSNFENPNIPTSSGANAKKKEEVVVLVDSEEELLALPTERDREREREKEAASKKPVFSNILLLTKDSNKEANNIKTEPVKVIQLQRRERLRSGSSAQNESTTTSTTTANNSIEEPRPRTTSCSEPQTQAAAPIQQQQQHLASEKKLSFSQSRRKKEVSETSIIIDDDELDLE